MQRPSRVLLISSCAMRVFFSFFVRHIVLFFLRFSLRQNFFFCVSSCAISCFFSAILRAPNRALNGATVTGHGQDTRYASDM